MQPMVAGRVHLGLWLRKLDETADLASGSTTVSGAISTGPGGPLDGAGGSGDAFLSCKNKIPAGPPSLVGADCMSTSQCADNVASCSGAPNGVCAPAEPCSCPDCAWSSKCVELNCGLSTDGTCTHGAESLLCPDCVGQPGVMCDNNGYCNDADEGCDCPDCGNAAVCSM